MASYGSQQQYQQQQQQQQQQVPLPPAPLPPGQTQLLLQSPPTKQGQQGPTAETSVVPLTMEGRAQKGHKGVWYNMPTPPKG